MQNTSFSIGQNRIGPNEPVFVIAEVGINHHGDPELCASMIQAAAAAGADAVKLQTVDAEESYVRKSPSYKEFRGKELDDAALANLMKLAAGLNVILFSTPGDFSSLEHMVRLGMPAVKISSGLMTNFPLIAAAARCQLPLIISTGLAYEKEMELAVETAQREGAPGIALLKCTALYPAPDDSINLLGIPAMARHFRVPIGYSDHTVDGLACTAAVALGAMVIEKHFTLDSNRPGADHRISMEPGPFAAMVAQIRRLEVMRGDDCIGPVAEEERARPERHRCLVARRDIVAGEVFSPDNIALKRPLPGQCGLPPEQYWTVLGRTAKRALQCDDPVMPDAVKGLK